MLFVVDTSSIIILEKLDWLNDLHHRDDVFIRPPQVIRELRNQKNLLKKLKNGIVTVTQIIRPISMTAISETDSAVVSLALEKSCSILSDDAGLREKAGVLGISAFNMAGFVTLSYQHGRFDKNECLAKLKTLVDSKLLSHFNYRQILRSI